MDSLKQALTWCLISNEPSFPTVLRSAVVDLVPVLACDVEPLSRGGKFSLTVVLPGEQYAHGMFEGVRLLTVTVTSTLPSNQLRDEPLASNCSTTAVLQKPQIHADNRKVAVNSQLMPSPVGILCNSCLVTDTSFSINTFIFV